MRAEAGQAQARILVSRSKASPLAGAGMGLGLLGVLAFSLTLPMTRTAVAQLDPWFVAFGRMSGAGLLAAAWLAITAAPRLQREDLPLVAISALGVVIGFPLLSSLAMRSIPANHGAIINGALPFATAVLAYWLFGEQQSRRFWIAAAIGSVIVIVFAFRDGLGGSTSMSGSLAMGGAVLIGALGYVTGGRIAARIGGIRAILWALVVALPITIPVTLGLMLAQPPAADAQAWAAFAYVTLVSQLIGFFAWYNGLARGGIARVGQVQLLQVFFTIGFAALLFGEAVPAAAWLAAIAVVASIIAGRRA